MCLIASPPLNNLSLDLDHTADIQIHGWGPRLETAMEQVAVGMFNYISELEPFVVDESCNGEVDVTGTSCSENVLYPEYAQVMTCRVFSTNF